MGRSQYTGLPRAPQLIGLPAASGQNSKVVFATLEYRLTGTGSVKAPPFPCYVDILVISRGGDALLDAGGGGGCGWKRRLAAAGEEITATFDDGATATGAGATKGSVSVDGMVVLGGRNGGSGGGLGGTATGGDVNRSGGRGGNWSGGGERGGSAASLTSDGVQASTVSTGPYSGAGGTAGGNSGPGSAGGLYGGGAGGGDHSASMATYGFPQPPAKGGAAICVIRFIPV